SFEQLRKLVGAGKLRPADLLCQEGMQSWVPAENLTGLFPEDVPLVLAAEPGVSGARRQTGSEPRPSQRSSWPLSAPLTIALAAVGGAGVLLGGIVLLLLVAASGQPEYGDPIGPSGMQDANPAVWGPLGPTPGPDQSQGAVTREQLDREMLDSNMR